VPFARYAFEGVAGGFLISFDSQLLDDGGILACGFRSKPAGVSDLKPATIPN
jgi:hypothetical protein